MGGPWGGHRRGAMEGPGGAMAGVMGSYLSLWPAWGVTPGSSSSASWLLGLAHEVAPGLSCPQPSTSCSSWGPA